MAAAFAESDAMLSQLTNQMDMYSPEANDELWRQCAAWLTRWEMLRKDHKTNWPEASIADFANILRDGVLLCKLVHTMDPSCIDMKVVNLKPTLARFLCLHNINLFLKACVESFGLKQSDLFDNTMLFDLSNFHKVLCTLSKLSLCPKVLRFRIPGFNAKHMNTREEDIIYQSLKGVDFRTNSGVEPSWLQFKIPCPQPQDWEEEIYDNLCYVTISATLPEFYFLFCMAFFHI
nr:unnamed protein product [Callosobruchus analis]